jgi:hypothetical protein
MSMMNRLSQDTLGQYLRGEAAELKRRAALEEVHRRGQEDVGVQEMIDRLQALGYEVLSPDDFAGARAEERCPRCGASYWADC